MTKGSHAHANHAHATLEKLERARLNGSAANGAEKGQLHLRSAAQGSVSSLTSAAQRGARLALLSMFLLVLQGTALSIALRYSRVKAGGWRGFQSLCACGAEVLALCPRSWPSYTAVQQSCASCSLFQQRGCPLFRLQRLQPMMNPSLPGAGTPYLASVSVLLTETAKLLICLGVQLRNCRQAALEEGEDASVVREFRKQMHLILSQALPMLLPAGMFVMQQVRRGSAARGCCCCAAWRSMVCGYTCGPSCAVLQWSAALVAHLWPPPAAQVLLIIAATHLDAVAFQIFSQSFKLVPTAFFAYWLLGQHLEPIQVRQGAIAGGAVI